MLYISTSFGHAYSNAPSGGLAVCLVTVTVRLSLSAGQLWDFLETDHCESTSISHSLLGHCVDEL